MSEHHLERAALRHAFHRDPEPGFQERRAKAKVAADTSRQGSAAGCFLLMGNGTDSPHGRPRHAADDDFNDAPLPHEAAFRAAPVRDRLPARKD